MQGRRSAPLDAERPGGIPTLSVGTSYKLGEDMDIEQVAVVGLAGRFPGAPNIDQFWQNLCHGVEARTLFTDEELRANVDPALLAYPGYVKSGFVLDGIEDFDADFFRFDAQQARITDPQQRLFLECVWEALETAGIDVTTYGGLVGVYAGASQSSYWAHARAGMVGTAGNVLAELIGNDKDYLATQTAYRLNLQGPCLSVQSACSTGLVAVHLACQSLLNHECDVALAGGVTVHVPHRVGYAHAEGSVFAADGRCCAFSAQATGMVFGNGIGVVVLKRLSEALADGDLIWAVVRGSAVNNDGARKFGFMTSSRMGQIEVITEAWGIAGVTAPELSYIETHGSGTPIGDVIEFSALAKLFGEVDPRGKSCAIGSVKSNVGHLETAAGITGFIKTVLALYHRQLPPSINFATPNPDIDFAQTPLYLNTTLTEWQLRPELGQETRCAGVSSFGIGGTNAHVVLEEAPEGDRRHETGDTRYAGTSETGVVGGVFDQMVDDGIVIEEIWDDDLVSAEPVVAAQPLRLLNLSAKNGQALRELVQRYVTFLAQATAVDFGDLCYTAQVGRSHFAQRLSLVAASAQEAQAKLSAFLHEGEGQGVDVQVGTVASTLPKIAFFFGGDPANFPDGGSDLYATQLAFRQAFDQCATLAAPYLDQPLSAFLAAPNPESVASPTAPGPLFYRFALDYALAALWQSWGIVPDQLSGQGVGDYVAATVAGVFSLADALKLLAAHSKMGQHPSGQFNPVAGQLAYRTPAIALIDGRTGQLLGGDVATAAYWAQPRLAPGAEHQRALTALAAPGNVVITSQGSWAAILADVGQLYRAGAAINWPTFYQDPARTPRKVCLPTYPFQRQRYWVDLAEVPLPHPPPVASSAPLAEETVPPPTWGWVGGGKGSTPTAVQLGEGEGSPPTIRQQLYAATKADQSDLLVGYLQALVAALLAADPAAPTPLPTIGLTVGFAELGMTSLGAVAMRNQLQSDLGQKLPATLVLDYPTVASLTDYLMQNVLPQLAVGAPAAPDVALPSAFLVDNIAKPAPSATAAVDALSMDEIAEKLAAKLGIKLS